MNEILDDDEGGLSGFTILTILATLLLVFVLVVYYAYRQGMASASNYAEELPVVAADPTPVAEDVPLDVARSDREEVYDRITNGTVPTRTITFEEREADPLSAYNAAPSKLASNGRPGAPERAGTQDVLSDPDPAVAAMGEPMSTPVRNEPQRVAETAVNEPAATQTAQASTTQAQTAKPEPAQTTPVPTPVAAKGALAGSHVVQVGAFDSNRDALSYFEGLGQKMGSLVTNKSAEVQVAEVKGRTYHRLRIGPFPSQSAANNYCNQLKTRGQECLVRGV
ncbi:MAG: SPOR domain-containing protein [Parvularcula sp.]|nr:SPOR domain-containing protein [Parvularcula sp.]